MNRSEILEEIIAAVNPLDEITEETVIADCDDLDSLGLFNVVLMLNSKGIKPSLEEMGSFKTVGDIIDMVEKNL